MHKKAHKQFTDDKHTKDMDYWNHVLWSDETKINLFGSDGIKRVWWQPGEEYRVEVCTGSKLKAEPGPYPRLSDPTRPDPSGTVKFRARTRPEITPTAHNKLKKKRKKIAFQDCMQRNGLIKALPFHKHLPVIKVCEHQVQRSHTFCRVYEFCLDKMMTVQIMVIFVS